MAEYKFKVYQYGNVMYEAEFEDFLKARRFYIAESRRDDQYTQFILNGVPLNTAKAEDFFELKKEKAYFCINLESAAKAGRVKCRISVLYPNAQKV